MEWEAFYGIDPWGEERADLRSGMLCSLTDACHRTKGRPDPPLSYMPYVKALQAPKPQQSEEAMQAVWAEVCKKMGRKK